MATSHFVLMVETDAAQSESLAAQLVRIGIEPIRVADLVEAVDVVQAREYAVRAILVPSEVPGRAIQKALKSMRRSGPILPCMAYGKAPDAAQRKLLRRAGVLLALWDGYDPGVLRFQMNRLTSGEHPSSVRGARRAPVHVPVAVLVGGREKEGVLYSIAEGGCFIESPRASMDGAACASRSMAVTTSSTASSSSRTCPATSSGRTCPSAWACASRACPARSARSSGASCRSG